MSKNIAITVLAISVISTTLSCVIIAAAYADLHSRYITLRDAPKTEIPICVEEDSDHIFDFGKLAKGYKP